MKKSATGSNATKNPPAARDISSTGIVNVTRAAHIPDDVTETSRDALVDNAEPVDGALPLQVFAHRCNGFGHPQNSMFAARAASESAVHGVELDARLTKDRKWVVLHDPFLTSEHAVMRVHEHLYSRLRREVMLLETMLALLSTNSSITVLIDVKDVGEERQLLSILARVGLTQRSVLISWEPEVLRRVKHIDPSMRIGLSFVPMHDSLRFVHKTFDRPLTRRRLRIALNKIESFDESHSVGQSKQHYLSELPDLPLYSVQVPALLCTKKVVASAHARGILVYPFGVTKWNWPLLRRARVDGIITDEPRRFLV